MTLEAFGSFAKFYQMIKILMKDASTQVGITESLTMKFILEIYIRQGCPLIPALFITAANAILYLLRETFVSTRVKGISLSNNEDVLNINL